MKGKIRMADGDKEVWVTWLRDEHMAWNVMGIKRGDQMKAQERNALPAAARGDVALGKHLIDSLPERRLDPELSAECMRRWNPLDGVPIENRPVPGLINGRVNRTQAPLGWH
jgi:hypothetical protein